MTAAFRQEGGYSVVELLTTMAILSVVMGGLTTLFVSGMRSELDINSRFQAQQHAGLALAKLRREVHCASVATPIDTATVRLTLPSYCKSGSGNVTWCVRSIATSRYGLYRKAGDTCDTTGVKWADHLTSNVAFSYTAQSVDSRAKLGVVFPVDVNPADGRAAYKLEDAIVLRNSTRAAP